MASDRNRKPNWKTIGLIAGGHCVFTAVLVAATMIFHRYFDNGFPAWMQGEMLIAPVLIAGTIIAFIFNHLAVKVRHPGLFTLFTNPITLFLLFGILFTAGSAVYAPIHYSIACSKNRINDKQLDSLYLARRDLPASDFGRTADSLVLTYLMRGKHYKPSSVNRDRHGRIIELTLANTDPRYLHLAGELTRLRVLNLTGPEIDTLPPGFKHLTRLTVFRADSMKLKKLPTTLTKSALLTSITAESNLIERFPEALLRLDSLKEIILNHNRIPAIPESIAVLAKLERLEVAKNRLEKIPAAIGKLRNLKTLNVSSNPIAALPDELGNLSRLQHLDVTNSSLTTIPQSINGLTALTSFTFWGNDIKESTLHPQTIAFLDTRSRNWRENGSNYSLLRFWDDLGMSLTGEHIVSGKLKTYHMKTGSNADEHTVLKFDGKAVQRALEKMHGNSDICTRLGVISYQSLGPSGLINGLFYALHDLKRHPKLIPLLTRELSARLQGNAGSHYAGFLDNVNYTVYEDIETVRKLEPFYVFWAERITDKTFDPVAQLLMEICTTCSSILSLADTLPGDDEDNGQAALSQRHEPSGPVMSDEECRESATRIRHQMMTNCSHLYSLSNSYGYRVSCSLRERDSLPDSLHALHDSITAEHNRLEDLAYARIRCYEKILAKPLDAPVPRPSLFIPDSMTSTKSRAKLPKAKPSEFLKNNPFFFLGAGPFFEKSDYDGVKIYKNLHNEPEIRLINDINRNTGTVMDLILGRDSGTVATTFGGPIFQGHHEECLVWPKAVHGIGSLTHILRNDFPVSLISEKGVIPGRLVQVTEKLFTAYQGCVSDEPAIVVGFNALPKGEILAMIVFYRPVPLEKCKVRRSRSTWTADLNGDGVDDLASVFSQYEGIAGMIHQTVWYANISGKWIAIDTAEDLDCT